MKKNPPGNQIAIQLIDVGKKYEIHHEKPTLVEKFVNGQNETFWALRNINLTIHKGERVGIIGPNGSGKTTLLKIIAGITTPTQGTVTRRGRIVSLIDLEAGFHPELTGLQNVYLNGMLLGLTRQHITRLLPSIIAFADIRQFIDTPLFTFSEGMKLRLGFAIAAHADPDILLLDESISVGDLQFQKKSQKKIREFYDQGKTILIVSHWLEYIQQRCSRIIGLKRGTVLADGSFTNARNKLGYI